MPGAKSGVLPVRAAYYESAYPLYGFDWSQTGGNQMVVLLTYREDMTNKLQVLLGQTSEGGNDLNFRCSGQADVAYPATKVQWDPQMTRQGPARFASSSQYLQLWQVSEEPLDERYRGYVGQASFGSMGQSQTTVQEKLKLINSKLEHSSLPPLTSFDWNRVDPNLILTSSVDTTCTLWDISKQTIKTQLIAHDLEVYDVKFIHNDLNTFFSVGADGSVRLFDLRSLEHSTIIYEPLVFNEMNNNTTTSNTKQETFPLLRLDTCKTNQNVVATSGLDSSLVLILDMRYPGNPTFILDGHEADINLISWHPTKQILLTGSDDCQALLWDLGDINNTGRNGETMSSGFKARLADLSAAWNKQLGYRVKGNVLTYPHYSYCDPLEINYTGWNTAGDWFGVVSGKGFQGVKTY